MQTEHPTSTSNMPAWRELLAAGPSRLREAVDRARETGVELVPEEIAAMADQIGRTSLSMEDYASARALLEVAVELDHSNDLSARGHRLCDLASAADGLGDVGAVRRHLLRAATLGELAGDVELVVRAAVHAAVPADWYAHDAHVLGLLERVVALELSGDQRVRVLAAAAFALNCAPARGEGSTPPNDAARSAEQALDLADTAEGVSDEGRLLALLAWRLTHRRADLLSQRRRVTSEALELAPRLRRPSLQVGAAMLLADDALESGDRPLFDQCRAITSWVATRDGNPRLLWCAHTLAASSALLDGDPDGAARHHGLARTFGRFNGTAGWLAADLALVTQSTDYTDDVVELDTYLSDPSHPALADPIGRACVAYIAARRGESTTAGRHLRWCLQRLDEDPGFLSLATRSAAVAELVDDPEAIDRLIELLTPWADHVVLDPTTWWCDGPAALWLAVLHHRRGDVDAARRSIEIALPIARAINDKRALRRIDELSASHSSCAVHSAVEPALTNRELRVLTLLADGSTNPEIARQLAYSLSTIRMDTVAIYRKLQVRGRAEAVARATSLGLL